LLIVCVKKKKECLNDKIKQIEEAKRRNKTKKFYKDRKTGRNTLIIY
jgi:hypothetical protein